MTTLILSIYAFMALFAVVCYALATAFGAQVKEVQLGFPRLFTVGKVKVGLLPLSSSVELAGRATDTEGNWFQLDLGRRLAITLLPWVTYALPALLFLGTRATTSIANGFTQLFLTPNLTPLMRTYLSSLHTVPPVAIAGVVFAKGFVANTPIAVGNLLHELRGQGGIFNVLLMLSVMFWISGRLLWGLWHVIF